ncbi:dimethylamine corrinoid protein 3 [Desulfosporosinus fructosivorans]|uniref:Dimethylamine corrinoid protein 3 n=1 Tax=Desulfosporosinus fructosivorans TaxID=2018669 RepID=A0A4Z0R5H9_9FIRM|nr:corrinoid protein [Desulfosporosinus fructosivorans]TGE37257.1 dimethylamine corrinoid protein 3 [Desulfosporosinus fructosivorans]
MSEAIYEKLKNSIVEMDPSLAEEAANEAIEAGLDPLECISLGLSKGMAVMGDLFDVGEAFVPDLMMASEAFETAINILTSALSVEEKNKASSGKVIIHTVQGDIHDIGKNIVSVMLSANNFEVFDLGRDVPVPLVIKKAEEYGVDLICGSALMTTTMASMKEIVNSLKEDGIRDKYIVMFGGAPVSAKWCKEIGADGYTDTAAEVAAMAKDLIAMKRGA